MHPGINCQNCDFEFLQITLKVLKINLSNDWKKCSALFDPLKSTLYGFRIPLLWNDQSDYRHMVV